MANSDTAFGLHNKQTKIYYETQYTDASEPTNDSTIITKTQSFADVATAQDHFFTANAMTCMNDHATQLEWAVVPNGLKYTIAFGIPEAGESWGTKWQAQMETLQAADDWCKCKTSDPASNAGSPTAGTTVNMWTATDSADHLF